jgi:hypothetical protein
MEDGSKSTILHSNCKSTDHVEPLMRARLLMCGPGTHFLFCRRNASTSYTEDVLCDQPLCSCFAGVATAAGAATSCRWYMHMLRPHR